MQLDVGVAYLAQATAHRVVGELEPRTSQGPFAVERVIAQ